MFVDAKKKKKSVSKGFDGATIETVRYNISILQAIDLGRRLVLVTIMESKIFARKNVILRSI